MTDRSNAQSIHTAKFSSVRGILRVIDEFAIGVLLPILLCGSALIRAASIHVDNARDHQGVTTTSDIFGCGTEVKGKPTHCQMDRLGTR
jgi:hypothetical protein